MRLAKSWISSFGAAAVVAGGLAMVPIVPAAATGGLTLDKQAPAGVLLGDEIPYDLVAANAPGPRTRSTTGVSPTSCRSASAYMAGSAPPALGTPTTSINGTRRQQVLVWRNVTDLQVNSDLTLSFVAEPHRHGPGHPHPPRPPHLNSATVASQEDPRTVPAFNPDGFTAQDRHVQSAGHRRQRPRTALPFVIEKSNDNSPEGELLRGVHKNRTDVHAQECATTRSCPPRTSRSPTSSPPTWSSWPAGTSTTRLPGLSSSTRGRRGSGVPALTIDPCPASDGGRHRVTRPGLPAGRLHEKVTLERR